MNSFIYCNDADNDWFESWQLSYGEDNKCILSPMMHQMNACSCDCSYGCDSFFEKRRICDKLMNRCDRTILTGAWTRQALSAAMKTRQFHCTGIKLSHFNQFFHNFIVFSIWQLSWLLSLTASLIFWRLNYQIYKFDPMYRLR